MMNFIQARANMVQQQVRPWGVFDEAVLELLEQIPREKFVPKAYQNVAYTDCDIPIGYNQKMLPPKVVGKALQALAVTEKDSVLEVGTGTGYVTALLGYQAKKVTSLEIIPELLQTANAILQGFALPNLSLLTADGSRGFREAAPFDKIIVTASYPNAIPETMKQQLKVGGRLFAILGKFPVMEAVLVTRISDTQFTSDFLFETVVDPLINAPQIKSFDF